VFVDHLLEISYSRDEAHQGYLLHMSQGVVTGITRSNLEIATFH
jgi:hypothetical protein